MSSTSPLNEASRWSNLARFANAPLARLTIAAPFIAFLLLFNEKIRDYLELDNANSNQGVWMHLLDSRLDVFYVGLVLLGASVAVFSFASPRVLKQKPVYADYIEYKLKTKSNNSVSASLKESLRRIERRSGIPKVSIYESENESVPSKVTDALSFLIENEFSKMSSELNDDEGLDRFYSGTGSLMVDEVLECLINQRRLEWNIWKPILNGSSLDAVDVFRLEYHLSDYSKPKTRKFLFALLIISSSIIFFPTALTLISALARILGYSL